MKLEWEQNSPSERMTWDEANKYAKSLGEGWRLPTRGELCDAYDNGVKDFKSDNYWSSSTYTKDTTDAWDVDFYNGYVDISTKTKCNYYVRCVREV